MALNIGPLLRSGNIEEFKPLGEDGSPVYQWATQIRASIKRNIGLDSSNILAMPQPNEEGDIIDWYAPEPGDVIPWSSATRDERIAAKEQLTAIQQQISVTAKKIGDTDNKEQQVFSRLLDHVIQLPNDQHVYLVNKKPVLTFWGFVELSSNPVADPLSLLTIPPLLTDQIDAIKVSGKKKSRWWWLFLFPLLLLILCLFLRGCDDDPFLPEKTTLTPIADVDDLTPVIENNSDIERNEYNKVDTPFTDVNDPLAYRNNRTLSDNSVVNENSELTPEILDNQSETQALPEPAPLDPDSAKDEGNDDSPVTPAEDPAQYKPLQITYMDEKVDSPVAPPESDKPVIPPEIKQQNDSTTPPLKPGEPIKIPATAPKNGPAKFVNGTWKADSGFVDNSGRPVELEYDFKDGKGNVKIKQDNGVVCSGNVEATMEDSKLTFSDKDAIKCPNGSSYQPVKVKCDKSSEDGTKCQGSYKDGEDFNMDVKKQ